jgi:hypothetical protein
MVFTSADLIDFFGRHTFSKGLDYARQHRVLDIRVRNEANPLELGSQVQGSGRITYTVHVAVAGRGKRLFFENDCSCPVGVDCKHVLATLIEFLRQSQQASPHGADAEPTSPIAHWLQSLETPTPSAGGTGSTRPSAQCLAYVLAPASAGVEVKPFLVRRLKNGGYGSQRKALGYFDTDMANYYRKDYHEELDMRILGSLRVLGVVPGGFVLRGELGSELLALLLRSGRCHWQELGLAGADAGCTAAGLGGVGTAGRAVEVSAAVATARLTGFAADTTLVLRPYALLLWTAGHCPAGTRTGATARQSRVERSRDECPCHRHDGHSVEITAAITAVD